MWIYENKEFIPAEEILKKYQGFVYIIENKLNGKKYIGKKFFWSLKKKQVKGKKKSIKVESDWQEYWSSSDDLKKDIELLGEQNFIRTIIHLCETRSKCTYYEAKEQFINGVLESDLWYNNWISCRVIKRNINK